MPSYFAVSSVTKTLPSLAAADALAATMNEAAANLGVRILAVRPAQPGRYVYAISSRHRHATNAVVHRLRRDHRFADYDISGENATSDGPFTA